MSTADQVAADLTAIGTRAGARAFAVTRHHGQLLVTRTRAHASGRPGPRAPTGDYRRSIGLLMVFERGDVVASAGTNKPQGARLEKGFVGSDSLGRTYHQPAYRHFGPALDETEPGFIAAIAALAQDG